MRRRHAFGLYEGRYHVLILDPSVSLNDRIARTTARLDWKSLDVSILAQPDPGPPGRPARARHRQQTNLRYHRDPRPGHRERGSGQGNLCSCSTPRASTRSRPAPSRAKRCRRKSTDFYPKMIAGLTMMQVGADQDDLNLRMHVLLDFWVLIPILEHGLCGSPCLSPRMRRQQASRST